MKSIEELYNYGMHAFLNDKLEESIDYLSQAVELDAKRKLTFVSRGSAYLKMDRIEEALADFTHAIDLDPQYARAFHLRGLVHEKAGADADALADFNRAIEIDPEYGAAYNSRATLHTKMGNEDLAVDDIAMVQHLTQKNIETFANENNLWRSQQMRVENIMETELER